MLYYNAKNLEKFTEDVKSEARTLGVDLVRRDLDRSYDYYTSAFQGLGQLTEVIVDDMRDWFSRENLNVKEMDVSIHNIPWGGGDLVRIQTRCKR